MEEESEEAQALGHTETIERAAGRGGHMAWHLRDSSRLDPSRARPSEDFRGLLPRAQPGVCVGIGLVTPLLGCSRAQSCCTICSHGNTFVHSLEQFRKRRKKRAHIGVHTLPATADW